ncbi:alpha/beta fold hydrolase [Pacificibacter sp. AS14]|uniref:alpha/beta fold hydrolase n=1 Tax=Pacificibacter sp. AS14 TaxID=3135785 RepID=UPI00317FE510
MLCHGWPEHAFSWRYQMPALAAAGYHVIVPNQRAVETSRFTPFNRGHQFMAVQEALGMLCKGHVCS